MQAQSKKEIKSEDDFNAVLDDILKENGIEVDEDSAEPVVSNPCACIKAATASVATLPLAPGA